MKKLLFLLVCVLLLLCAVAAPAVARDTYPPYPANWYFVSVDGSTYWMDEVTHTWGPTDLPRTVPADDLHVAIGGTWFCATYGQCIAQAGAVRQTLDFWKDGESEFILSLDERAARAYWGRPYDPEAAYGITPEDLGGSFYNPKVQSGFWAIDWIVWIGPLEEGTYWLEYKNYTAHNTVDPHFEKTPIHYPKGWVWADYGPQCFVAD